MVCGSCNYSIKDGIADAQNVMAEWKSTEHVSVKVSWNGFLRHQLACIAVKMEPYQLTEVRKTALRNGDPIEQSGGF